MNDDKLKSALAKMLPDIIYYVEGSNSLWHRGIIGHVRESELLHLCALVEKNFNSSQKSFYYEDLKSLCALEGVHTISATWQQRATALAKVKGIEL